MTAKGERIMETFEKMIPKMNEQELDRLASFSEGMAFMKDREKQEEKKEQ